jgi:hypothetical protein
MILIFLHHQVPRVTTIALSSDPIRFNAPIAYTNNLVVTGTINMVEIMVLIY